MPIDVIMPSLGAVEEESTLVAWLVEEGDTVEKGQPIFEAESDKAVVEIEAPESGIVGRLLAAPGDVVRAGTVIALLLVPGEELPDEEAFTAAGEALPEEPGRTVPPPAARSVVAPRAGRIIASPVARRLARERGVDLGTIAGTGPGGRIVKADVEETLVPLAASVAAPVPATPLAGVRGVVARRMAESASTTAAVTLTTEVDAAPLVGLRRDLREAAGERGDAISYDLLMGIVAARALLDHPALNASLAEGGVVRHSHVNVGVAVDTAQGLVVPVLADVPNRGLLDLAADLEAKVARARGGRAAPGDLDGGTFTVTNLGLYGVDAFTPIINLPECAILGIGRIRAVPVARQGEIVPGQTMALSLTFDHRLVDGAPAARFLQQVASLVERPVLLLLR
jgi:pyruvate dehydrogenase E2 component (dihydrolipoamide acetyltransferase)